MGESDEDFTFFTKLKSFLFFKKKEMMKVGRSKNGFLQATLLMMLLILLKARKLDLEGSFLSLRETLDKNLSEELQSWLNYEAFFLIAPTRVFLFVADFFIEFVFYGIWSWLTSVLLRGCGGNPSTLKYLGFKQIWILWHFSSHNYSLN